MSYPAHISTLLLAAGLALAGTALPAVAAPPSWTLLSQTDNHGELRPCT